MTKWVSTDYDGCSYITPGKRYEVMGEWCGYNTFTLSDDDGGERKCLYDRCSHIGGNDWTVHDTPSITIEPGKYYRTRYGQKVGPMRESECGDAGGVWGGPTGLYRKDGTFGYGDKCYCHELDIIAEWSEHTRDPEASSPYGDGNHPLPDVTPTTGTLRELNVKPGDVVECVELGCSANDHYMTVGKHYEINADLKFIDDDGDPCSGHSNKFRIISRASTYEPEQEVDQLRNERNALQAVIDGAGMMERAYKDSAEAYNAIHAALTYEVESSLESCEYASAMKAAELMRDIEGHTDINHGDA